ncbi:MAG: patatin-like phospholipase family protein [Rhodospirillales bacterium]|nr:patatin-like phospholipase family protein [Rhodospirillales bacterium]
MTSRPVLVLPLAAAVTLTGCEAPTLTSMRASKAVSNEYSYSYDVVQEKLDQRLDSTFLAATFSGGGMRAATLAYGALRAIGATTVQPAGADGRPQGQPVPLIDEFDFVSSISGGSVTAAYWALHGPDRLHELETGFLGQDVEQKLTRYAFSPATWFRLPLASYSRIDALRSELVDVLGDTTYGTLLRRSATHHDRPYLVISAANMTTGSLFPFTQLHFDLICSDLSVFRVADAVAASAAYPVWFNSLGLKNHREAETSCPGEGLAAKVMKQQLELAARIDELGKQLTAARAAVKSSEEALEAAEKAVDDGKLALARAEALEVAKQAEVDRAAAREAELTAQHVRAARRVTRLQAEQVAMQAGHDQKSVARAALEDDHEALQDKRERERGVEQKKLDDLDRQLE